MQFFVENRPISHGIRPNFIKKNYGSSEKKNTSQHLKVEKMKSKFHLLPLLDR